MTMTEMKKYDDTKINAIPTVAERLPELDEEAVGTAQSHHQLAWCHGFMDNHKDGQMLYMDSHGVHLQRVNETESRCVAIVDHTYCYTTLAMLVISFEKAGVNLQIDPYTVVTPYEPRDEEEGPPQPPVDDHSVEVA